MGNMGRPFGILYPELQTLDSFQRFLRGPAFLRRAQIKALPRLLCADGFGLSVQASDFHCCEPRSVDGPYSTVECAYPTEIEPELMPYLCEEEGICPEHSAYHFVPVSIVVQIINDHGGLVL